ncbi:hypothetical protein [Phormidium sp. CCY1219]|uniref:hypothetical protein n=1 Tax=Phormidium sp. CCY1219 TaxID=2886104 RepID=UPI002D1E6A79|nr:hypothetical protein [Phormidium sp. CCY1219]MEB3828864.1 hypothetical protein [Phormidium sp. CCY1219]
MATAVINTIVSQKELHLTPGGEPASLEVTVVNGSDRFASFGVELTAAGAAENRSSDWYSISPTVSSKKPPGDVTSFRISITDTPVPGFVGLMNVRVRVFSLELPDETREILRLIVEQGIGKTPLQLDLPVQDFQIYPGDRASIPVRVYNPGQLLTYVTLTLTGIDGSWTESTPERHLQVAPGKQAETVFTCQPPFGIQAPSQLHNFAIVATHSNGPASQIEGRLEVLPMGFLDFSATPKTHHIPEKFAWKFWRSNPITYTLEFNNASNLYQEIGVEIGGEDRGKCTIEITPETAQVEPEQVSQLFLTADKKRPWFGKTQKLLLEVAASWSARRVDTRNDKHSLQLSVKPITPLWLQIVGILGIIYLVWWFSWLNPQNPIFGHQDTVNSVQFNGMGERLVSGSNDQRLIEWNVAGFFNPLANQELREINYRGNRYFQWINQQIAKLFRPQESDDKAVRVIRYRPVNNNFVVTGLENGEILVWDLIQKGDRPLALFIAEKDDRVFALEFTQDSRFLFSGHGSGRVHQWDVLKSNLTAGKNRNSLQPMPPMLSQPFDFAISALKFVGRNDRKLAVVGRYNNFVVWDWIEDSQFVVPYRDGGKENYITSIDTAEFNPDLVVTADNQGYITLWNMQPCLSAGGECEIREVWNDGHQGEPVRSVAFSADGCYLVSGGDDGRVMLWPLRPNGTRLVEHSKEIYSLNNRSFNSTDIKVLEEKILIAGGTDDSQEVRLKSEKRLETLGCDAR